MDMLFKWLPVCGNFKLCFLKLSGVFFFSEHFLPMVSGTHWGRTHGCGEWVHCPWLTVNRINNTTKYIESSFFWIPCFFRELTPLFHQVLGWQDGGAHRISWWAGCGVLEYERSEGCFWGFCSGLLQGLGCLQLRWGRLWIEKDLREGSII